MSQNKKQLAEFLWHKNHEFSVFFPFASHHNTVDVRLISFDGFEGLVSTIPCGSLVHTHSTTSGFGKERRRVKKGVMLQVGKTDYSDCRRVRLAGRATPSFWQRWIPLVMSSNERASFIPLSRGVYEYWKKEKRAGRRRKREKRGKREKEKTETVKKARQRRFVGGRKTRRV